MHKIIFLDIDGPVITDNLYEHDPYCSVARSMFNIGALDRLEKLCYRTGAKIVTNSMHNYYEISGRNIKHDLISWDIPEQYFHTDWRTIFPDIDYKRVNNPRRGIGRLVAIETWIARNGPASWVCFDDRHFTDDARLLLVDPALGITEPLFEQALALLGEV